MAYRRILVPVDGSDTSTQALTAALQLARDSGGRVRLLHVIEQWFGMTGYEVTPDLIAGLQQGGERILADASAIAASAGVEHDTVRIDFALHRLGDTVAEEAQKWDADLIVVGTHGRRGLQRALLGSGAEQIIRHTPLPVLVIRGREATSAHSS